MAENKFIAFLGLPGSGKSTVSKELANLMKTKFVYNEPEENEWDELVSNRDFYGHFNGLMWFRNTRIKELINAKKQFDLGNNVIMDSYYDKAVYEYIGKPGMEWLLDPDDVYFNVAKAIAKSDWNQLPNVTDLILLELDKSDWDFFVNNRNRNLDKDSNLLDTFTTQKYFLDAAKKLAKQFNINLIVYKQKRSSPAKAAHELYEIIQSQGE